MENLSTTYPIVMAFVARNIIYWYLSLNCIFSIFLPVGLIKLVVYLKICHWILKQVMHTTGITCLELCLLCMLVCYVRSVESNFVLGNHNNALRCRMFWKDFQSRSTCSVINGDCMLLSCHVRVSDWIHTVEFLECQETACSKQARYLKFKWQQLDPNSQPPSS